MYMREIKYSKICSEMEGRGALLYRKKYQGVKQEKNKIKTELK